MLGQAIGQRYPQVGIPAKTKKVTFLTQSAAPAFRESFLNYYARFTGLVFLSWELSDELGKLPKGMASPGRLRTHPTKIGKMGLFWYNLPPPQFHRAYGCFLKVVQSKKMHSMNEFLHSLHR
jgi:hypothetical protein